MKLILFPTAVLMAVFGYAKKDEGRSRNLSAGLVLYAGLVSLFPLKKGPAQTTVTGDWPVWLMTTMVASTVW